MLAARIFIYLQLSSEAWGYAYQDEAFAHDAYINPFSTLHTTVMTCHGFTKPTPENHEQCISCWRRVLGEIPERAYTRSSASFSVHLWD
jgi:hypothetical protein